MNKKALLYHPSLHFIAIGTGKMHALDVRFPGTMCGKDIPQGQKPQETRQYADSQLCKRCLASLRTYTSEFVRFEKEGEATA